MNLIFPALNINGTDGETLADWHYRVIVKMQELQQLMIDTEPHPRDYVHNPPSYSEARQQHVWRLAQLEHLLAEYRAVYENLWEQIEKRKAVKR